MPTDTLECDAPSDSLNVYVLHGIPVEDIEASSPHGMRSARQYAVQMAYQVVIGSRSNPQAQHPISPVAKELAISLADYIATSISELESTVTRLLNRGTLERVAIMDRCVLFVAIAELRTNPQTPPAVVINEAVEMAKIFGTDGSPRFINGILSSFLKSRKSAKRVYPSVYT